MRNTKNMFRSLSVFAACVIGVCASDVVFALDRVTMKDGTVYEGEIIREESCCVWIKVTKNGKSTEKMVFKSDAKSVEKNVDSADKPADEPKKAEQPGTVKPAVQPKAPEAKKEEKTPAKSEEKSDEKPAVFNPGVPRAAVITLGDHKASKDMVGVYLTAYALEQARPMLEEEIGNDKSGVVVLRVSSGGGALFEIQRVSDEIQFNYKPRFRVVAWIESAISAAAMSSLCIEEIYFTPVGNFGACTGWFGNLQAVKGVELERVLAMMRSISARGGYHPDIMRAMQIQYPLSCTIDEDGKIHWYGDTVSGKIIVNRDGEILTFNEKNAREVYFSKGTAATIQELQQLMGYQELNWVGETVEGTPWPVCKAEKWTLKYRDQTKKDEDESQTIMRDYQRNVAAASGSAPEDRPPFVAKARKALERLKRIAKNNEGVVRIAIGADNEQLQKWIEEQEKMLKDLLRDK
jgi:hypothetical protein